MLLCDKPAVSHLNHTFGRMKSMFTYRLCVFFFSFFLYFLFFFTQSFLTLSAAQMCSSRLGHLLQSTPSFSLKGGDYIYFRQSTSLFTTFSFFLFQMWCNRGSYLRNPYFDQVWFPTGAVIISVPATPGQFSNGLVQRCWLTGHALRDDTTPDSLRRLLIWAETQKRTVETRLGLITNKQTKNWTACSPYSPLTQPWSSKMWRYLWANRSCSFTHSSIN